MRTAIDFSEVAKLASDLAADAALASGAVEKAVANSTARLHARSVAAAPVASGELKGDIRQDPSGLSRRVYATVRQAFYQEYGTSRHPPQPFLMVFSDQAHSDLEQEIYRAKWGLSL